MNRKILYFLLFLILTLGAYLRYKNISTNPPELFSDEIVPVLSSQIILKTGYDVNGKLMPFFYDRLQLYPPLYGYLTIPSIYLLGLNTLAIRLPGVIAGVLTILIIFLLTKELFGNLKIALFSSFFSSITPWTIHFSRNNGMQSLFLLFALTPTYFFLKYIRKKSVVYLYLSIAFFAISFYTYASSAVLSPIFLVLLTYLYRKHLSVNVKHYIFALFVGFAILLPFFYVSVKEPVLMNGRTERISTFARGINKDTISIFTNNYFSHFTLDFLFFKGDPNLRQGTGKNGVLYISMLPLMILGIYFSIKNIKKPQYQLLLIWILIFPLGGSLTNDGVPHATRTLIGAPLFIIISAVGTNFIIEATNKIKQKTTRKIILVIFATSILTAIFFQLSNFYKVYFTEYPIYSSSWWEYGQKEVFETVKANTTGKESICLTNVNYWHEETLTNYYLGINNNYKITYDSSKPDCFNSQILVIDPQTKPPKQYFPIKIVYGLEKNPLWIVYHLH